MFITNLTGDDKYCFDSHLLEKCLNNSYSHRHPYRHIDEKRLIIPFCGEIYRPYEDLDIIKDIPIYLVAKKQCKKSFQVGYFGHMEDVHVPEDCIKNPVPKEWFINKENVKQYDSKICENIHGDNYDVSRRERELIFADNIDMLGCYIRDYPQNRAYGIEESHPKVFIWVDKIMNCVGGDEDLFVLLTTQVILHEIAHAMMDVHLLGNHNYDPVPNIPEPFYSLKEESLANAISLSMIKPHIDDTEWSYLVGVVNREPFQYALGLDYLDKYGKLFVLCVENWVNIKQYGSYSQKVVDCWMEYIQCLTIDQYELEQLDSCLDRPNDICRYKGKYYDWDDVCVEVIKDYAKQNSSISRQEMHAAFPDNINDTYEQIIDYPENTEFKCKIHYNALSVSKDNIISCRDGEIAVCDYCRGDSIVAFKDNAARIGINIKTFED